MNKQFDHKDYLFNIKVELNTKVEKRIDGDRWHTVTCNCMDFDNYYEKKGAVLDKVLVATIEEMEDRARDFIDRKLANKEASADERLTKLGFK